MPKGLDPNCRLYPVSLESTKWRNEDKFRTFEKLQNTKKHFYKLTQILVLYDKTILLLEMTIYFCR